MDHPTVRFRRPGESEGTGSGLGSGLPADLLQESRMRVRIVALLVLLGAGADTILMLVSLVMMVVSRTVPAEPTGLIPFVGNLVTVTSAAGMVFAAGSARVRDTVLLRLALAFEVFLCLLIAVSNTASVYEASGALPNLTWVTPIIIFFPLIVPCPPRRTLVTAVLAAATRPLGIVLLGAAGQIRWEWGDLAAAMFSPGIAVAIAYFGSRVIYGLGLEVAEARRMGSYTLERLLGRGGMGEVWLGRHRLLARPAAVKLVRPEFLGEGGRGVSVLLQRFEREAQATATLRSPHTIEIFDFGRSDDGTFYYVMELLDGLDANTMVRRFGPLAPERAIHVLRQVCHSLAEAHESGLIHRDIKPANVYLCRYGRDFDFVKLLDFGLVKTPAESEMKTMLTAQGAISGTPAFMAPEQAKGTQQVDARSDVYSVGCLAYWLLTGQIVFERNSVLEMLMDHVRTPPELPSSRVQTPIPAALDKVVMACLEKDPAQRPQSAAELSARLAECGTGEPWTNERARQWWEESGPETVVA